MRRTAGISILGQDCIAEKNNCPEFAEFDTPVSDFSKFSDLNGSKNKSTLTRPILRDKLST
jgi:hypothetical protein